MKKPFTHIHLSLTHRCMICGKGIKMNVLVRKDKKPLLCYKHWKKKVIRLPGAMHLQK